MIHRASKLFLPTLREPPADAEAASHQLLVRGGFIRQVGAGLWSFLPLGWRVHMRIEQIIREEIDGIGDTVRVSLTADPVEEVKVAWEILKSLGLRERGPVLIACPSCGRDNVGVQQLAERVEERLATYPQHFEVAVLGCAVNGPGESGDADFGIAGGRDVGFVYAHGRVLKKVDSEILVDELFDEIDRWIADGMHRPKRLKMAKPAALAMAEASAIPLE